MVERYCLAAMIIKRSPTVIWIVSEKDVFMSQKQREVKPREKKKDL